MRKKMNVRLIALLVVLGSFSANAQLTLPRTPSPAASVSQTIGISTINVAYSRPSVKKREVWGKMVPYGYNKQAFGAGNEAPWRAGANENTVITFSHEAKVEGQTVPAGTYGLFFTINTDNNTGEVILSKDYQSWGSFFYDQKQDQLRMKIQLRSIPHVELLTYDFENITKNSADLVLNWEKKQFPVNIQFDVDKIVMKNANEELKGSTGFSWQNNADAANYALANKVNLEQAITWIDRAIAQNKNFQTLSIKSGILAQMGKKDEAEKLMADAIANPNAGENDINLYGYQLLNDKQNAKAIEVFILNTKRFPASANTWDSLGEAYATTGDKAKAIESFKKSLTLNPPANTKANSEKFLKELGGM
ncbi:MAG: DUF2911 domain-containing protein [Bacteroidota bacterium]